jgi:hypothetical protein
MTSQRLDTGAEILFELKRDYHADLWTAVDQQHERLYALMPRLRGSASIGVLWFGHKRPSRCLDTRTDLNQRISSGVGTHAPRPNSGRLAQSHSSCRDRRCRSACPEAKAPLRVGEKKRKCAAEER